MIVLVDNIEDGHHKVYENTLLNIKDTISANNRMKFNNDIQNVCKYISTRKSFLKDIEDKYMEEELVHLLYIDNLYTISPLIKFNRNTIGTLHFYPTNKIKIKLLKVFSKKLKYIIVHSEYLKNLCINDGITNVKCIDYPAFVPNYVDDIKVNKEEKIVITCLGGTRYDKGIDILANSFKYINEEIKSTILFNIVGKEEDIKFSYIRNEANRNNINVNLKNKYITEREYWENIIKSDIILLPYRKIFGGNSGPMTDGIYFNKFIIGPSSGNLGFLIKKYNLGVGFDQENERDLADKISRVNEYNFNNENEYRKKISVDRFINKYQELYYEIIKENQ